MTKRLSLLVAVVALLFTACKKEELTEVMDTVTPETISKMETLFDDIDYEVDYRIEEKSGIVLDGKDEAEAGLEKDNCPTITWSAPPGTFPNTVVIDFGDGCVSATGRVKAGQIVVNQSAPMPQPGATRSITLVNFSIDSVGLEGTKTVTNNGPAGPGQRSFTYNLVGGQATFPNGTVATRDATRTLTQLDGLGTDTFIDDIFAITGNTTGVNRNGVPYSMTITEPLIKERNCLWFISGTKELTYGPHFRSIDFGNGFCDNLAQVCNVSGQCVTINLHP